MADQAVTIPAALHRLALEAVWEILATTQALAEHYGQLVDPDDQSPFVIRSMALRSHDLGTAVLSILDDTLAHDRPQEVDLLRRRIMGEAAATEERAS